MVDRRTLLKSVGVGVATPFAIRGMTSVANAATESWTIAVIPDTQKYAETAGRISYAHDQTKWIVNNRDAENIRFVTHCGDLVENADVRDEWDRIDGVMARLDGVVPYSTVPGNHDWVGNFTPTSIEYYRSYFGPGRYRGKDWYGGSGPDGLSHYQFFSVGGYKFLHLALEWEAPGSVKDGETPIGWARKILRKYPTHPTILTTHSYLTDGSGRMKTVQGRWGETTIDGNPDPRRANGNAGQTVWQDLVKSHSQIFMVFNGHFSQSGGENAQVSQNDDGLSVYEIMADYQRRQRGGDGWMRLVSFVPGGGANGMDRIQVRTYSPSRREFETDRNSHFSFDLVFEDRFSSRASDAPPTPEEPDTPAPPEGPTKGDVDGDGDVDERDVELVQRRLARYDDDIDTAAADVDGDGDVDVRDAVAIRNMARQEK